MSVSREEIQRVKDEHDCREIAGERTQLRGREEMYGPCPHCGGDDRFHAKRQWWMCRQCHPRWADVIDLVKWLDGIDFYYAVVKLGGDVDPFSNESGVSKRFFYKSQGLVDVNRFALDYLVNERKIREKTASLYDVRFVTHKGRPAIEMPWTDWHGNTSGYRYRFADSSNSPRMISAKGSKFAGLFFGILWPANPDSTLFVVEGEINAMSIRQVGGSLVDVVSVGSESVRPTEKMRKYVKQYKNCIVWMDRPEVGEQIAFDLLADAWITPDGYDPNEVLRFGEDALKRMITAAIGHLI